MLFGLKIRFIIFRRKIKYAFQRLRRGFSDQDVYDFYGEFTDRNYKLLKCFREKHCTVPWEFTEKQWNEILDEMTHHLEMMDEDKVRLHLKEKMPENWESSFESVGDVMERNKNAFFDLMKEHFYNMWY